MKVLLLAALLAMQIIAVACLPLSQGELQGSGYCTAAKFDRFIAELQPGPLSIR
jgi:hypothetical protein